MSDDFSASTLDPSSLFVNRSLLRSYGIASGLYEEPVDGALWYDASTGYQLGGVMARDPASDGAAASR